MEVNRIYCESNMGTMARMPDGFIDLTITSPPYNLGKSHHTNKNRFEAYDIYNDAMPEQEYQALQVQTLTELHRVTSPNGSCFTIIKIVSEMACKFRPTNG